MRCRHFGRSAHQQKIQAICNGNATPFTMQGLERARKKPPAQEQWLAMKKNNARSNRNNEKSERDIYGSSHAIGSRRGSSLKSFDFLGLFCSAGRPSMRWAALGSFGQVGFVRAGWLRSGNSASPSSPSCPRMRRACGRWPRPASARSASYGRGEHPVHENARQRRTRPVLLDIFSSKGDQKQEQIANAYAAARCANQDAT